MKLIERMATITRVLTEEGLGFVADRLSTREGAPGVAGSRPPLDAGASAPARLRRVFERLGTMYIKFGQVLSTREDLLPREFCEELGHLTSKVPPFPSAEARAIIEAELGKPIDEVFDAFEDKPLAAASLAQVHAARLKDGRQIVVKVQRPDATNQVKGDTEMLLFLSRQLDRFLPPYKAARIHNMAEEFVAASLAELDFRHEAKVAERFRKNFEKRRDYFVPAVHAELTTARVLTMERVVGHKLDSLDTVDAVRAIGHSVEDVVKKLLRAIMTQAYVDGLIHADMHPGNVFLLDDGRLALIDFGLYTELGRSLQNALFRTVLYRTHNKHAELADAMIELMEASDRADPVAFRAAIIKNSQQKEGVGIAEHSLARSIQDESRMANEYGYVAPNAIIMLSRALVTAEGIAIKFTPQVSITEYLEPIMKDITLERFDLDRIARDGLLVLPDILEMIELAPAFHRNVLKVERAFARSASLSEFLDKQRDHEAAAERRRRQRGTVGPYLLAIALSLAGVAALLTQQRPVQSLGDLSILSALLLVGAVVTTSHALSRRP